MHGKVRENNKNAYIIFSSAHLEYILEAYKFKTFDFLPKPVSSERLENTLIRLFEDINFNSKKYISISNHTFINQDDIYFIEKDKMKVMIYTKNKTFINYIPLSELEKKLPNNFIRCHKSYIANTTNISNIDAKNNTIIFSKNAQCYIGPKYKNSLMEVFYRGNFKCINYNKSRIN